MSLPLSILHSLSLSLLPSFIFPPLLTFSPSLLPSFLLSLGSLPHIPYHPRATCPQNTSFFFYDHKVISKNFCHLWLGDDASVLNYSVALSLQHCCPHSFLLLWKVLMIQLWTHCLIVATKLGKEAYGLMLKAWGFHDLPTAEEAWVQRKCTDFSKASLLTPRI